MNGWEKYKDIIDLPHPVSAKHARMPVSDRAAQFAPFAALTGYGAVLKETERLTEVKAELDEGEKARLNEKLQMVMEEMEADPGQMPEITVTFFVPDGKKDGGAYETVSGHVKRIDEIERVLVLKEGERIPIEDISEIMG